MKRPRRSGATCRWCTRTTDGRPVGVGTWTFSATNHKPRSDSPGSLSAPAVGSSVGSDAPTLDAPGAREATGGPARPAAQPEASSPERAPSATRRAHRLDQPEAGACPPTRKADRTSERSERNARRSR